MTTILHPDRYSSTTQTRKYGVVVHTSESNDGTSASLIRYMQSPGDRPVLDKYKRPVVPARFFGSGYSAIALENGSYLKIADDDTYVNAAPPVNGTWHHICMPGHASQTRDEWLDPISRQYIKAVAQYIYDMWLHDGKTWSPQFRNTDHLRAAWGGYTSHACVALAWKKSDHWDPGQGFPWDVLAGDIQVLIMPPPEPIPVPQNPTQPVKEESDMLLIFTQPSPDRPDGNGVHFLHNGEMIELSDMDDARKLQASGIPCVGNAEDPLSGLSRAGLDLFRSLWG